MSALFLMDIGELELCVPTVSEINEQLVDFTKDYTLRKCAELVTKISADENLPRDKLMKYLQDIEFDDIASTISSVRKPRRQISPEDRCCAKTSKGDQCTRKKKNGKYCGSHCNSCPYGEVEEEVDTIKSKPKIRVRISSDKSMSDTESLEP